MITGDLIREIEKLTVSELIEVTTMLRKRLRTDPSDGVDPMGVREPVPTRPSPSSSADKQWTEGNPIT